MPGRSIWRRRRDARAALLLGHDHLELRQHLVEVVFAFAAAAAAAASAPAPPPAAAGHRHCLVRRGTEPRAAASDRAMIGNVDQAGDAQSGRKADRRTPPARQVQAEAGPARALVVAAA